MPKVASACVRGAEEGGRCVARSVSRPHFARRSCAAPAKVRRTGYRAFGVNRLSVP